MALGLSMTSCSSDDKNSSGSIEGKWTPVKMGTILAGQEILSDIPNEGKCDSDIMEFIAGGKFTDLTYEFFNKKCTSSTDNGTWSLKDKTLTTTYDGDTEVNTFEVMELTKSTLKIKQTEKVDASNSVTLITLFSRK